MNREMKGKKVCFVASSGGHLEEIARLKELALEYDSFLITEKGTFSELQLCEKVYYTRQTNRNELLFPVKFLHLLLQSARILWKERPDVIISTGALTAYPVCLLGRLHRKKIIYLESFARVEGLSLTGRLMKKVADVYIVQWEELLSLVPNAVYLGGVF